MTNAPHRLTCPACLGVKAGLFGVCDRCHGEGTIVATGRPPQLFTVPAPTPPATCRSCGRIVYFVTLESGTRMPIDCVGYTLPVPPHPDPRDPMGPRLPGTNGAGVSHFATCPNATHHQRPR